MIVGAGTVCVFSALGLGRFALGMLLPAMGEALNLSYSEMGLISTVNFTGYLLAVLVCNRFQARMGARRLICLALLLVGASMFFIGWANSLMTVLLFYTLTGLGSGAANVPMMGLIAAWFNPGLRGCAGGFVVIGSGFAILLSGRMVPALNAVSAQGWRLSWFVLGSIVLLAALICGAVLRDRPAELGLQALGSPGLAPTGQAAQALALDRKMLFHCGAIYFIFGFTYVIYATFIVTLLVDVHGFSEDAAGLFWAWVGGLSLLSGPIFGSLSDKLGRRLGLMLVFAIQTLAYLLVALQLPGTALLLSIGCFGIVAWSIPTIMTALVADVFGIRNTVRVLGLVTFVLGVGQVLGPLVAGLLAERGCFGDAFLLAAVLTLLGLVLSFLLPS